MAATGLQMFWSGVSFTIAATPTNMNKITDVSIDYGVTLTGFAGDADRFNTTLVNSMNEPKITVSSGNIAQLNGLAGSSGTFTATHNDAKGATAGSIVYSLVNAVCGSASSSGAHGEYGAGTLEIQCSSSDGVTSPLAFTRV